MNIFTRKPEEISANFLNNFSFTDKGIYDKTLLTSTIDRLTVIGNTLYNIYIECLNIIHLS